MNLIKENDMKKVFILILSIIIVVSSQIEAQVKGHILNKTPYDIFLILPYSSYTNTWVVKTGSSKDFYNGDNSVTISFPPYVDTSGFAKAPAVNNLESGNYVVTFDKNTQKFAITKLPISKSAALQGKK